MRGFFASATTALTILAHTCICSYVSKMPHNSQQLLMESMDWMDNFYDSDVGYLRWVLSNSALQHETRSSAWYAVGLLARNKGEDVANAEKIIKNIIGGQFKDPKDQWYGTYQQEPEEPVVGSPNYPATIYGSWDPNWRSFVGTTFIVALEEFEYLMSEETASLILESVKNSTIGDYYRVGGVDGDNFYPSYSNPAIMSAFQAAWAGRRLNDSNMTFTGETLGQEVIDLFTNSTNTLSEFNSPTYTGVSLWALSLWDKYLPSESVLKTNAPLMITSTWETVGELWHPQLKNLAGSWDRAYGWDMNRYVSLIALHIWNVVGKEQSSLTKSPQTMSHADDFSYAPLFAIMGEHMNSLIPKEVEEKLTTFSGTHSFNTSIISPAYDYGHRNITAWLAPNISVGGQTFNEVEIGGPRQTQNQFNPGVVQWRTGSEVGFITLWPTEKSAIIVASPWQLNITYPNGTDSSVFSFLISTFKAKTTITGWDDIPNLAVTPTGNMNSTFGLSFAGLFGGADKTVHDFEYWNITYTMPAGSDAVPNIVLNLAQE